MGKIVVTYPRQVVRVVDHSEFGVRRQVRDLYDVVAVIAKQSPETALLWGTSWVIFSEREVVVVVQVQRDRSTVRTVVVLVGETQSAPSSEESANRVVVVQIKAVSIRGARPRQATQAQAAGRR